MGKMITLPRLAGTRNAAVEIVADQLHETKPFDEVVVNARALATAAPSFVDELIEQLHVAGVHQVHVVGGSEGFIAKLSASAALRPSMVVDRRAAAAV